MDEILILLNSDKIPVECNRVRISCHIIGLTDLDRASGT